MAEDARLLQPAMPSMGAPEWPGAVWIGSLDRTAYEGQEVRLAAAEGYSRCRLLVVGGPVTIGFVDLDVSESRIDPAALHAALDGVATPERVAPSRPDLAVTVAISTRNRPEQLAQALDSVRAQTHPDLDILIVDNGSDSSATEDVVRGCGDARVRYVREPRPGLSCGRNRALVESRAEVVAFTDDDIVADRNWVSALAGCFDAAVGVVTGMVPTGEMRTPPQRYFELLTGWSTSCVPRSFSLADPPADIRAFPLDAGRYGTGANFGIRRELAIGLGGFNEALGIGSPTCGGEDLDMFVRALYAGANLTYTPDAVIWHRHRADRDEIEKAVVGYSVSFTAWMTALVANPDVRWDAVRIGAGHVRRRVLERLRRAESPVSPRTADDFVLSDYGFEGLPSVASRALLRGPGAYVRSRRSGRDPRPLRTAAG